MKLPPDFRDLLEEFARDGVEHVIVGGYAFAFHAVPRATKDLDLLVQGSDENRERAARALTRYGAPARVVEAVRALKEDEVAYFGQPPLRVDLLRKIDGVDLAAVFRNAIDASWDGVPVRVISLDDLISNKRAAGRPQDAADADRLEKVRSRRARK
jgi:hypothetical protein